MMVTLHSWDDKPTAKSEDEIVRVHVIENDFSFREIIECFEDGTYFSNHASFTWKEQAEFWRPHTKGWLYESELMQLIQQRVEHKKQEIKRKPIQIAAVWLDSASIGYAPTTELIALCDDGTMWSLIQGGWTLLPPIPQDQPTS